MRQTKPKALRPIAPIRTFQWRAPTTDNWAPSFKDSTVEVRVVVVQNGAEWVCHSSVWGEDDMGMEHRVEGTRMVCIEAFQAMVKTLEKVTDFTIPAVKSLGFVAA